MERFAQRGRGDWRLRARGRSRFAAGLARVTAVVALALVATTAARALEPVAITPAHRLAAGAPEWRELTAKFAALTDAVADFEERRTFPFRKEPIVLKGEVRVSRERGLSLHYRSPEERVVLLDEQGTLVRDASGQTLPPDPRASAGNRAMLNILRLDLAALEREFEVYGRREAHAWSLALVPRAETLRRAIGNIFVVGEGTAVRMIELRRSAKQHIDIAMAAPRSPVTFTADELKRYFR